MGLLIQPHSELVREPNLLVPEKQPTGQVTIDRDHPLAQGLHRYYPLWQNNELVRNSQYVPSTSPDPIVIDGKKAKSFNGSTDYYVIEDMGLGISDFTVSFWMDMTAAMGAFETFAIFGESGTSEQNSIALKSSGDFQGRDNPFEFRFIPDVGASLARFINGDLSAYNVDEGWHHWVGVRKSNTLYGYIDGNDESASNTVDADETWDLSTPSNDFCLGRYGSFYNNDALRDVAVWSRALSVNEILSLYRDPYQFLVPV